MNGRSPTPSLTSSPRRTSRLLRLLLPLHAMLVVLLLFTRPGDGSHVAVAAAADNPRPSPLDNSGLSSDSDVDGDSAASMSSAESRMSRYRRSANSYPCSRRTARLSCIVGCYECATTYGRHVYNMAACCRQCQLTQAIFVDAGPEQCSAEFIVSPEELIQEATGVKRSQ